MTSTKLALIQQEHPDIHNKNQAQSEYNEHNVVEFVKPKKKKKKKAAVISD